MTSRHLHQDDPLDDFGRCRITFDVPPFFELVVACPHSVVTAHLIDAAGEPTIEARDEILALFSSAIGRLRGFLEGSTLR